MIVSGVGDAPRQSQNIFTLAIVSVDASNPRTA